MEREKMIEDMADKIEQSFLEESRKEENKIYPWQELPVFRSVCEKIASSLVSQNVQIIPEGAVVLTREQQIADIKANTIFIDKVRDTVRKETAREIYDRILEYYPIDKQFTTLSRYTLDNIFKWIGVEVDK